MANEAQAQPVEGTREQLDDRCLMCDEPESEHEFASHKFRAPSVRNLLYQLIEPKIWRKGGPIGTGYLVDAILRDFTVKSQGSLSAEDDTRYSIAHACVGPMAEAAGYLEAHGTGASKDIAAKLRAAVKSQFIGVTPRAPEPPTRTKSWTETMAQPTRPADAPKPDTPGDGLLGQAQVIEGGLDNCSHYTSHRLIRECDCRAEKLADFTRSVRQRDREKVEEWRKALLTASKRVVPTGTQDNQNSLARMEALLEHGPEWEE